MDEVKECIAGRTQKCKICDKILPIEQFSMVGKYRRSRCKKCRLLRQKERRAANKTDVSIKLLAASLCHDINAIEQDTPCAVDDRTITREFQIRMSPLTYEELLRKQIWYDEPKKFGSNSQWVEPIDYIIQRLLENSSAIKVYNYKTFQKKRAATATVKKTIKFSTHSKLKKIKEDLKDTDPKITFDEIIWRLIENDKTTT